MTSLLQEKALRSATRLALLALGLALVCGLAPPPSSPETPPPIEDPNHEIAALIKGRDYAEAERAAHARIEDLQTAEGTDSLAVADLLDLLVEAEWRGGKSGAPETRGHAERAVRIREGAGAAADHARLAKSLHQLGLALKGVGDLAGARPFYERALALREEVFGPESPEVASTLNSLANLLFEARDFAAARPLYERALAAQEKLRGPDDRGLVGPLLGLGNLLALSGDYGEAKAAFERALRIEEGADRPDDTVVATILNNLANLLKDEGDYAGARSLYERAVAIREKSRPPDHPDVAQSLGNLGLLLTDMGDYAAAEPLLERALRIHEQALGPSHPNVASTLNNLGHLRHDQGRHDEAEELYRRALAIWEHELGPEHRAVALALSNLASLHEDEGDYAAARPLYDRILSIEERALGPDHPKLAASLLDFGRLLEHLGDLAAARAACQRSLSIFERSLGPGHPYVAAALSLKAELLAALEEPGPALAAALRAEAIGRDHLRLTARGLPERQALRYAAVRAKGLDLALGLAARDLAPDSGRAVWDALIRSRALVLDEMAARARSIAEAGDPEIAGRARALAAARRRLANLVVRGPGEEPAGSYRRLVDAAEEDKERAERALAERSAAFREAEAQAGAGLAEVAAALPAGWALVAFARFAMLEPGSDRAGVSSYLAFVLARGGGDPAVVALGAAAAIDSLAARWRAVAGRSASGPARRRIEAACRDAGAALRRAIWDPVALHLDGAARVLVVPDGPLHLVNIAALPAAKGGGFLVDSGLLVHVLSAERDLAAAGGAPPPGAGLLAVGGPAFDESPALAPSRFRGALSDCREFQSLRFDLLGAAARETAEIAAIWTRSGGSVLELSGARATEAAFKTAAPGRRVLHLATHGFFLGGSCPPVDEGAGNNRPGENPLLRSGLALAGANRRAAARPDEDDGVLTAEELTALDLGGVEWAVLSACETALGDVEAGEGVLGLRRAFQIAGAGTVIMSLWRVGDEEAREWMAALYEARLGRGMGTAEAVREASRSVLSRRRARGQGEHPFTWAGFIAAGDWQ